MAKIHYAAVFGIDWNDGTSTYATTGFPYKKLSSVFKHLFEKVVQGFNPDPSCYTSEMINEIDLKIFKKVPGENRETRRKKAGKIPIANPADTKGSPFGYKYTLRYSVDFKGTRMGSLDFTEESLKELFDQLFEVVVIESITDPCNDKVIARPEEVGEIGFSITKKRAI